MSDAPIPSRFPTTHWSLIGRIQSGNEKVAAKALEEVFTTYRYPLYGYLRSCGMRHEDAEDVLQDFFAKLLRTESLRRADHDRGKLRTFLLGALSRFRINWRRDQQRARGPESAESDLWDADEARYQREKRGTEETAEVFFDRRWAIDLVHKAKGAVRDMYERKHKLPLHDAWRTPSRSMASSPCPARQRWPRG